MSLPLSLRLHDCCRRCVVVVAPAAVAAAAAVAEVAEVAEVDPSRKARPLYFSQGTNKCGASSCKNRDKYFLIECWNTRCWLI